MKEHRIICSARGYRVLVEEELLDLIREAVALDASCYSEGACYRSRESRLKRYEEQERLSDVYREIGRLVVEAMKELPF